MLATKKIYIIDILPKISTKKNLFCILLTHLCIRVVKTINPYVVPLFQAEIINSETIGIVALR